MKKNPRLLLDHILESIRWIEDDVRDLSREEFFDNVPIQDAVVRRLEIIGEASRALAEEFKLTHSEISWQEIADMRNKLIHEYFAVDLELVWNVVQNDLPDLRAKIKSISDSLSPVS